MNNSQNYTTLQIWNGSDTGSRAWVVDNVGGYGQITGLAQAAIRWNNNDITAIGLQFRPLWSQRFHW